MTTKKIGIIFCSRYATCAGGKCLRALRQRDGAFSVYRDAEVELVGFTGCGGCPGGNIEYAPAEMIKNGYCEHCCDVVLKYASNHLWKD